MATLHPAGISPNLATLPLGLQREWGVVQQLVNDLPEDWQIFHNVAWQGRIGGGLRLGEWDIVVVSPSGNLAILEVKSGSLEWGVDGPLKRYGDIVKNVADQTRLQHQGMIAKFKAARIDAYIGHALVLTDAIAPENTESAGYTRSRTIDAAMLPHLAASLCAWIRSGTPDPTKVARISAFLRDELHLSVDPRVFAGQLRQATIELQDGLATWLARLELPPGGALCVSAAAGAGKTLLALRWLERAKAQGENWRYVCFNRPLADALRSTLPELKSRISTFHELAIAALRRQQPDVPLDFSKPDTFSTAVDALAEDMTWVVGIDGVLIDEAVDLRSDWFSALHQKAPSNMKWLLLLDHDQQAHPHAPDSEHVWWQSQLPQAVRFASQDNFRSPRALVDVINAFHLADSPVYARHPFVGEAPDFLIYPRGDRAGMLAHCESTIRRWLDEGISAEDIAVLSFVGRGHSQLLNESSLAGLPIRRFTGGFDANGEAIWSEGRLFVDTVLRFKGQSAPAVLIAEVDWRELDATTRRRLYIGLTRAELKASVVISDGAAKDLAACLDE